MTLYKVCLAKVVVETINVTGNAKGAWAIKFIIFLEVFIWAFEFYEFNL